MGLTSLAPAQPHAAEKRRNSSIHWLGLGTVLVVSAALRLHGISADSLWLDEAVSWRQSSLGLWDLLQATAGDNCPPLHNLLLHASIRWFGDGELALRLPSAMLGVAGIAAVYWVGSLVRGPAVGLVSAALLGLSRFDIWYSQEARPYALLALTATLFVGSTLRALESGRAAWQAVATGAAVLLLYSHPYGALLWLSIGIAVVALAMARREPDARRLAKWATGQAIAALLFLPWAWILAQRYEHIVTAGFWIHKPNVHRVLAIVESLASGRVMAWILVAGAAFGLTARTWLPEEASETVRASTGSVALPRFLLLAWLLGPLLLALTASLLSQPILHRRYLICSLPALMIAAAAGTSALSKRWGGWILAASIAAAIVNASFSESHHRQDFRRLVAAYREQAQPGDCVFLHPAYLDAPVLYYLRNPPTCLRPAHQATDVRPWELASKRAWLFLGHTGGKERRAFSEGLQEHGWQERTVADGRGIRLLLAEPDDKVGASSASQAAPTGW